MILYLRIVTLISVRSFDLELGRSEVQGYWLWLLSSFFSFVSKTSTISTTLARTTTTTRKVPQCSQKKPTKLTLSLALTKLYCSFKKNGIFSNCIFYVTYNLAIIYNQSKLK